jgi:hypothetical protein
MLWLLVAGQILVALTAGNSEYQRLILSAMPGLIILLFVYIDQVCFAIDWQRWRAYESP